jgi:hypothetical protein
MAFPFRFLPATLLALALVSIGCGDGGAPSASPTAQTTATGVPAIGSYTDQFDFRSFATQLDKALRTADVQFFLDHVSFEDLICANDFTAPPSCAGQAPGSTVPGIIVGVFQSEGFGLDAAGYRQFIREFLTNVATEASDAYGDAKPRLYAYAIFRPEFQRPSTAPETIEAIAIRIAGPRPVEPQVPGPPLERGAVLFSASFDGQRWTITHLATGPASDLIDPTDPNAVRLFEFWQRWE